MTTLTEPDFPRATDGEIAAINLESVRRGAWARFAQDPGLHGAAEAIVYNLAQFLGDLDALDRLEVLASQSARTDESFRSALVQAEVASTVHRFSDAREHLARAARIGAPREEVDLHLLSIDQACGVDLDAVLAARGRLAAASGRLEDLVPFGALLADLLVPVPDPNLAALWYRRANVYLPGYVKARVHPSEIYASQGQPEEAEVLLMPALSSSDPDARWRLADVLSAQGKFEEAKTQLDAAQLGFKALLGKHPLAFADHAAEFYAGSGNDHRRALDLARVNVANRLTRRATKQANAIAVKWAEESVAGNLPRESQEKAMIKVSVIYPSKSGARFDHDYYRTKHLPLIKSRMGAGLKYYAIDKGLAGGDGKALPAYIAMCHLLSDSMEAYQCSFGPYAKEIHGDIANFTDVTPIVQISDVVVENSTKD